MIGGAAWAETPIRQANSRPKMPERLSTKVLATEAHKDRRLINTSAFVVGSIQPFVSAVVLQLIFAVQLGWLPPSGYVPLWEDPLMSLETTIMPAFVLGTGDLSENELARVNPNSQIDQANDNWPIPSGNWTV